MAYNPLRRPAISWWNRGTGPLRLPHDLVDSHHVDGLQGWSEEKIPRYPGPPEVRCHDIHPQQRYTDQIKHQSPPHLRRSSMIWMSIVRDVFWAPPLGICHDVLTQDGRVTNGSYPFPAATFLEASQIPCACRVLDPFVTWSRNCLLLVVLVGRSVFLFIVVCLFVVCCLLLARTSGFVAFGRCLKHRYLQGFVLRRAFYTGVRSISWTYW